MSLKKNILANYVSQFYVTLIGIVLVPMYVRYMGTEAYGLVGFFTMLQAWFQMLDMGLSPTMSRETAKFNGSAEDALNLRRLLRALEGVFLTVAVCGVACMLVGSNFVAKKWLKIDRLPLEEVILSLKLMAGIVALRWACGLYRGAVNGFERMVWLSGFNILIATLRFVVVIPLFIFVGTSPTMFFGYQLCVAVLEFGVLVSLTYHLLPRIPASIRLHWEWAPLKEALRFSLSIAFTSTVWVLVTQTDKLVLSRILPLGEYAYFTLAVLVASGINVVTGPVSAALLPRMIKFSSTGNDQQLISLYRDATQFVACVAMPLALMLGLFPDQMLFAWSGDAAIATRASGVLALYGLGNGILAVAAFPYYLQFAKGNLRLHLIGNAIFVAFLIPSLIWLATHYGMLGAGYAWLASNFVYFLFWTPVVHNRFAPGLHMKWLVQDVGVIVIVVAVVALSVREFFIWPIGRADVFIALIVAGFVLLAAAVMSSSFFLKNIKLRLLGK